MKDYYKVLGVPRNATGGQIKRAYRKLIKACHPDVNSSPKSIEWTRELNEAYGALVDAQARTSHDRDLKSEESRRSAAASKEPRAARSKSEYDSPHRPGYRAPSGTETSSAPGPTFFCENCNLTDSSLRIATTWRVISFMTYVKRSSTVNILCSRCRVKESLAANAITLIFGWWSFRGFVWTLEALVKNARGGEQSVEDNVVLLNALASQFQQSARLQEAYQATLASFSFKRDPKTKEVLELLRPEADPVRPKSFWRRLVALELHPICYHALAAAAGLVLLFQTFRPANSDPSSGSSTTAPVPTNDSSHLSRSSTRQRGVLAPATSETKVDSPPTGKKPGAGR